MKDGAGVLLIEELGNLLDFPDFSVVNKESSLDIKVRLGYGENDFFMVSVMMLLITKKLGFPDPEFMKNLSGNGILVFRFR